MITSGRLYLEACNNCISLLNYLQATKMGERFIKYVPNGFLMSRAILPTGTTLL